MKRDPRYANKEVPPEDYEEYLSDRTTLDPNPKHQYKGTRCRIWKLAIDKDGYGKMSIRINGVKTQMIASRFAFKVYHHTPPDDLLVCHHCDNPPCCNPEHLFLGVHQSNTDDSISKKRNAVGTRVGSSKLNNTKVRQIRIKYKPHVYTCRMLGIEYGVNKSTIWKIVNGKFWVGIN